MCTPNKRHKRLLNFIRASYSLQGFLYRLAFSLKVLQLNYEKPHQSPYIDLF